jgi:predicted dehydrogenase
VLDLLDHLLGEFVEYGGTATACGESQVEDNVALHFRTSSGVIGAASWDFAADRNEETLEIQGTKGRVSTQVLAHGPLKLEGENSTETLDIPDPPHIQQPLIQTVVDELAGTGKCPSSALSAARTSKVMDAALSSFYAGRDDEFWTRSQTWSR